MVGLIRSLVVAAVVCASVALSAGTALAGREWCDDDPIFTIGSGAVRAHASWTQGAGATGVAYVLEVPSNVGAYAHTPVTPSLSVSVTVARTLAPWNGGPAAAILHTTVTSAGAAAVNVDIVGSAFGSASGTTNQGVTLVFQVPEPNHLGNLSHSSSRG